MRTKLLIALFLVPLILGSGCDTFLSSETIVRGRVVLQESDEPISNAAIIIRQIHVYNSFPQNDLLVSAETIPCDEEGYFVYSFESIDSANEFNIVAALWDTDRNEFVGQNTICRIGDWVNCNGLQFGQVYKDYVLEITGP